MPKNIVLLSDGTGNSAAKLLKTNVWRIYESLDLTDPTTQVACYDDGIGTSSFRPLALLGGMFGIGLRRNVLRLYRFLCEHYDEGDRIYVFGFSRGAFTVRVLANLICTQGIIRTRATLPVAGASVMRGPSGVAVTPGGQAVATVQSTGFGELPYGSDLGRAAGWAYREFRRKFNQTGGLVALGRSLRDVALRTGERIRGRKPYETIERHTDVRVAFVGVWDTVDAYGLAVDELTDGIDRWIWPLSMPDLRLHHRIDRACHVIALDDERNTFHPVLWDETGMPQDATHIDQERITQVWFAGMHANVGGGYADDALSAVSLKWMTQQVERQLTFIPHLLAHHTAKADPLGRIYDSRDGFKGYYRYNPRRIEWLTNAQQHERPWFGGRWPRPLSDVRVGRPKIHESVFTRMAAAPEAYAPIVLPEHYAVVMNDGSIVDGAANPYEKPDAARRRVQAQQAVWDLVWWRRLAYFSVVAITAWLILHPFGDDAAKRQVEGLTGPGRIIKGAGEWLPSYASPWINYYASNPRELILAGGLVLLLWRASRWLQGAICGRMRSIWLKVLPPAINRHILLAPHDSAISSVRESSAYQGAFAILRRSVLPNATGLLALLWVLATVNRVAFETANGMGLWCEGSTQPVELARGASRQATLDASTFCGKTGILLVKGDEYEVALPSALAWSDGGVRTAYTAAGFDAGTNDLTFTQRAIFLTMFPFKRLWSAEWFVPIARVGRGGLDQYRLDRNRIRFTPSTTGELFLFVNDAVAPIGLKPPALGWSAYYRNNQGSAAISITRLERPAAEGR